MVSQSRRFLPLPFFFSLLGVLFSLWNLWGDPSALCITEGCSLFQDFTFAGVSLWWLGVAGFAALLAASVPGFSTAGLCMAGVGVALDCALLAIMVVTAQCFNCMLVGLMLVLVFIAYRHAAHEYRRERAPLSVSPLVILWGALFVINAGGLAHAGMTPWQIESSFRSGGASALKTSSSAEAPIRIYFSPSCSACRSLVENSAAWSGGEANTAIWYPVAENSRDIWIIADMASRMSVGAQVPEALNAALTAAPLSVSSFDLASPSMLLLQFRLWRNKAHVLNAGSQRLPFVEFHGVPAALMPKKAVTARPESAAVRQPAPSVSEDLPFLNVTGFCDGGPEPCADPANPLSGSASLPAGSVSGGMSAPVAP